MISAGSGTARGRRSSASRMSPPTPARRSCVRAAAGEMRIVGVPASRAAAVERVREVAPRPSGAAVSAFSLADLEQLAAREA